MLTKRLEVAQYECWLDREDIRSGELWTKQIVKAIHDCEVFILVLSPDSVQSREVRRELDIADNKGKRIVPIILHAVASPATVDYQLARLCHT